jgi:hypothetical protein
MSQKSLTSFFKPKGGGAAKKKVEAEAANRTEEVHDNAGA